MRRGGRGFGRGAPNRSLTLRPLMNIPRQLQPPQQQPQFSGSNNGASVINDHLQGLKDIDIELELLKRKREIIEQQQQMLANSYRQRSEFENSFSQPRESRYDNFLALYDGAQNDSFGREESRKRMHNVPVWASDASAPAKRFAGPRGGSKSLGSRNAGPSSSRFAPRSVLPETRFPAPKVFKRATPPPKKPHKDFNPSRVSKPQTVLFPLLSRYAPEERKRLVTEAGAHTEPSTKPDMWLVRADCHPNPKLNGRLELALGAIMKDVKAANPQHERLFKAPLTTRTMKAVVRERIRSVMIGKYADTIENMKAAYYSVYPCRKHDFVVMQGLDVQREKNGKVFVFDSDDPATFFKTNLQYLMAKKLDEMIKKLQTLYNVETYKPPPQHNTPIHRGMKNKTKNNSTKPKKDNNDMKLDENETQSQDCQSEMQRTAEAETTKLEQETTESKQEVTDTTVEDNPIVIDVTEEEKPDNLSAEEDARRSILKFVDDEQYIALDKLMTMKMIHLLKNYTPELLKLMEINKTYRQTKAEIMNVTMTKLKKSLGSGDAQNEKAGNETDTATGKPTPEKRVNPLYYVKILGKPSLPKRKAMEVFFKDFQPRSIKKHKTMHNLLFVGFSDKESYDKILSCNGTTIGRYVLDIKVSERYIKPNNNTSQNSIITIEDDDNPNNSTESTSDLDSQITELLSSIRKSEYEADGSKETTTDNEPQAKEPKNENEIAEDKEIIDVDAKNVDVAINAEDKDIIQFEDVPKDNGGTVALQNKVDAIEIQDEDDAIEKQDETQLESNKVAVNDAEPKDGNTVKSETVEINEEETEKKDDVAELKTAAKEVPKTPSRVSARLATPGGIRTRRMSKLVE